MNRLEVELQSLQASTTTTTLNDDNEESSQEDIQLCFHLASFVIDSLATPLQFYFTLRSQFELDVFADDTNRFFNELPEDSPAIVSLAPTLLRNLEMALGASRTTLRCLGPVSLQKEAACVFYEAQVQNVWAVLDGLDIYALQFTYSVASAMPSPNRGNVERCEGLPPAAKELLNPQNLVPLLGEVMLVSDTVAEIQPGKLLFLLFLPAVCTCMYSSKNHHSLNS